MMQIEETTALECKTSINRTELTTLPSLPASNRGECSPLASELAYWLTTPTQTVIGTNAAASSSSSTSEVRQNSQNSRENGAASSDVVNLQTFLPGEEELLQAKKTTTANIIKQPISQEEDSDDSCSTVPNSPISSEGHHILHTDLPSPVLSSCISDDESILTQKPNHKTVTKSIFINQHEFKTSIPISSSDLLQESKVKFTTEGVAEPKNAFIEESKIHEIEPNLLSSIYNNPIESLNTLEASPLLYLISEEQKQLQLNDGKLFPQIVEQSSVGIKCQDENESSETSSTESEDSSDASSSSDRSDSLTTTSSSTLPTNNKSDNELDITDNLQNIKGQPESYTNLYQGQQFNQANLVKIITNKTDSQSISERVDGDFYVAANGNAHLQEDNFGKEYKENSLNIGDNASAPLYKQVLTTAALANDSHENFALTESNLSSLPLVYESKYEFSVEQARFEEPAVPIETLLSLKDTKSEAEPTLFSIQTVETAAEYPLPSLNAAAVDQQELQTNLFWNHNGSDTQTATSFCEDFVAVPHLPSNLPTSVAANATEPIATAEPRSGAQTIPVAGSIAPTELNSEATLTSFSTENSTPQTENSTQTEPPRLLPASIWPILLDHQKARIVHELSVYESLLLQEDREREYRQNWPLGEAAVDWNSTNLNEAEVFVWLEQQTQRKADNNNSIGDQTVQMGIENWFSTIRNLIFSRSNHTVDPENNIVASAQKRRPGTLKRSEQYHPIKYRRVDNTFPKIINTPPPADLNDDGCMPTGVAFNSMNKHNFVPRHASAGNNESSNRPRLRTSFFGAPHTIRRSLQNQNVCEIDLSDDDDDLYNKIVEQNIRGSNVKSGGVGVGVGINVAVNGDNLKPGKIYNVQVERTAVNERTAPPPPPLLVADGNDWLATPFQRVTHGSMNHTDYLRCSSSLSSHETPTAGSGRTNNNWSLTPLRVVPQGREIDERAQYLRLLQQYEPRVYGGPEDEMAQRRARQSNQFAKQRVSDIGRPLVVNSSCFGTLAPPLSSTINLDEMDDEMTEVRKFVIEVDGDDDIENVENIVQHSNAKSPSANKSDVHDSRAQQQQQQQQAQKSSKRVATVNLIDDDFEDVIDLSGFDEPFESKGAIKQQPDLNTTNNANSLKITPVNSLEARLLSCDLMKSNWSRDFAQKWNRIYENKVQDVKYLEEQISIVAAEREKKTHEALSRRLKSIKFNDKPYIDLEDLDYADDEKQEKLLPLTEEHRNLLQKYLSSPSNKFLVSKFNLNITREDIVTLLGINWLNDEVINFYMNLLTERSEQKQNVLRVYAMNTFFVPRLLQGGHAAVRRWTRKVDIFAKDVIPVPVHVGGVHWCMAIIHLKEKSIKYYDSMGKPNPGVLRALELYLQEESLDKRKMPFDTSDFRVESVADSPRQANGSDCGVFSCMTAEYVTRGRPITFSQANMEYFRQKMILEIVGGKLWH